MSKYKSLLKQTAIYGISSIVLRLLSWFLTPYYTHVIPMEAVGIYADLSAMIALLNIVFMLGMETSYFRFTRDHVSEHVFKIANSIVIINSAVLSFVFILFASPIVEFLKYPGKEVYIYIVSITLFLENCCNIPFAELRYNNNSTKFVALRVLNVLFNILLNLYFISIVYKNNNSSTFNLFHDPVVLILIANLIPWALTFLIFSQKIVLNISIPSKELYKTMMNYSKPLLLVGIAGMINETMDRSMLKYLLPYDIHENLRQIGIYNANYKLSIVMTLVIQAFKMGAEPFFFKESKSKDAAQTYAKIMDYFIIGCCFIFVITCLNQQLLSSLLDSSCSEGLRVLPYLLLANMFLGIFYNTSVWFKVTDKTHYGAIIALVGAIITLVLNYFLIPTYGYMGSAYTTLVCYFSMMVISVYWGQKHYPIPYHFLYNIAWIVGSILIVVLFFNLRGS